MSPFLASLLKKSSWLIVFSILPLLLSAQPTATVTIQSGAYDRLPETPVFFPLPPAFTGSSFFELTEAVSDNRLPAQRWSADSAVFQLNTALPAGQERRYRLTAVSHRPPSPVYLRQNSAVIELGVGEQSVLTYHLTTVAPPAGEPAYYQASGFIHPLYTPGGAVLTDDFPVEHRHQHGVFLTWVNTTFRGEPTDFWNQQNQTGTVRHVQVLDTVSGPVFARFRVRLQHFSLKHGPVLEEERTFTVFPAGSAYLLDVVSEQRTATSDPLLLNEYHYGGLAFRGNARWNPADSTHYRTAMQVLTSDGITRAESNHTRPRWIAAYGDLDGPPAGVAVLDHPVNFRFPQPVRVHPDMPYFCLAPMVAGAFSINPGQVYHSRYRLVTYDGPPLSEQVEQWWTAYAQPLSAKEK